MFPKEILQLLAMLLPTLLIVLAITLSVSHSEDRPPLFAVEGPVAAPPPEALVHVRVRFEPAGERDEDE